MADFGLARQATGGSTTGKYTHITRAQSEALYGSKAYLPKTFMVEEGGKVSTGSDVYSFGIVSTIFGSLKIFSIKW